MPERTEVKMIPVLWHGEAMTESLILAQNERWRRVLSMQVERMALLRRGRKRRTGE